MGGREEILEIQRRIGEFMKGCIFKTLVVWLVLLTAGQAIGAEAKLSSAFLARGEKTLMEIRVEGSQPDEMPVIPPVKGVDIEVLGIGPPRRVPGSRIEYGIQYLVSSYEVGVHVIPAIEVSTLGTTSRTAPLRIEIFDPSDLKWGEAVSKPDSISDTIPYASIIRVPEGKFFDNQTVETEMKIYVPRDLARTVADWGVPEFKPDGLAAWRFEAKDGRGEVNLLGQSYIAISYGTTMTALRSGPVTLGSATVRLTYVKMIFDRFAQRAEMQATLDIAEKSIDVIPLPDGAPVGFDNVVGDFTIGTAFTQSDVVEGEPISVDVIVSGSGNLDLITAPQLLNPEGWKVYDTSQTQRGEERRELEGSVVFKLLIRPLEIKAAIPPFRLVYFDPKLEEYKTIVTEPIPLKMAPAVRNAGLESLGPPQEKSVPVERMTDILGLVGTGNVLVGSGSLLPSWTFHALAGLLALGLIAKTLWMRFGHLFERDETKARMRKDFENVMATRGDNGLEFLRAAGAFVETWLAPANDDEVRKVLEERDKFCFRPDREGVALPGERRKEILRVLRKVTFGMLVFGFSMFAVMPANGRDLGAEAKEAFDSAKYNEAAQMWLDAGPFEKLSADTLYNIGNSAYRLGVPGEAALYYRRALIRDASHEEARQNLRFIERKYGSITIDRPDFQHALAKISLGSWRNIFWSGVWIVVLGLLIFPATRQGARFRVGAVVGFILGPILVSGGGFGWYYYPDDSEFAAVEKQAVIIAENVVLHTDAARTSPEVIDAPPGSLAEVIRTSGRWAYVGFATKTRGWVPIESIGMLQPKEKPEVPKVRKAAADGSSA